MVVRGRRRRTARRAAACWCRATARGHVAPSRDPDGPSSSDAPACSSTVATRRRARSRGRATGPRARSRSARATPGCRPARARRRRGAARPPRASRRRWRRRRPAPSSLPRAWRAAIARRSRHARVVGSSSDSAMARWSQPGAVARGLDRQRALTGCGQHLVGSIGSVRRRPGRVARARPWPGPRRRAGRPTPTGAGCRHCPGRPRCPGRGGSIGAVPSGAASRCRLGSPQAARQGVSSTVRPARRAGPREGGRPPAAPRVIGGRQVLERVHGQVDLAATERLAQGTDEDACARRSRPAAHCCGRPRCAPRPARPRPPMRAPARPPPGSPGPGPGRCPGCRGAACVVRVRAVMTAPGCRSRPRPPRGRGRTARRGPRVGGLAGTRPASSLTRTVGWCRTLSADPAERLARSRRGCRSVELGQSAPQPRQLGIDDAGRHRAQGDDRRSDGLAASRGQERARPPRPRSTRRPRRRTHPASLSASSARSRERDQASPTAGPQRRGPRRGAAPGRRVRAAQATRSPRVSGAARRPRPSRWRRRRRSRRCRRPPVGSGELGGEVVPCCGPRLVGLCQPRRTLGRAVEQIVDRVTAGPTRGRRGERRPREPAPTTHTRASGERRRACRPPGRARPRPGCGRRRRCRSRRAPACRPAAPAGTAR